jgi:hypothetical protein
LPLPRKGMAIAYEVKVAKSPVATTPALRALWMRARLAALITPLKFGRIIEASRHSFLFGYDP